jgi:hypothetical protein
MKKKYCFLELLPDEILDIIIHYYCTNNIVSIHELRILSSSMKIFIDEKSLIWYRLSKIVFCCPEYKELINQYANQDLGFYHQVYGRTLSIPMNFKYFPSTSSKGSYHMQVVMYNDQDGIDEDNVWNVKRSQRELSREIQSAYSHNFHYFSSRWKQCLFYGKIAVHPRCESLSWLPAPFLPTAFFHAFLVAFEIVRLKIFSLPISRLYNDKCYYTDEELFNSELPLKFILAVGLFMLDYIGFLERYIFGSGNFSSYVMLVPLLQAVLTLVQIFNFSLFLPVKLAINELFIQGVSWSCYLSVLRVLNCLRFMLILFHITGIDSGGRWELLQEIRKFKMDDRIRWAHYLAYNSDSMSMNSFKEALSNISREDIQNGIINYLWTIVDIVIILVLCDNFGTVLIEIIRFLSGRPISC